MSGCVRRLHYGDCPHGEADSKDRSSELNDDRQNVRDSQRRSGRAEGAGTHAGRTDRFARMEETVIEQTHREVCQKELQDYKVMQ